MSGRKHPLRVCSRKSFPDAELQTLKLERVPETQIWCVQRLGFRGSQVTELGYTQCRWYVDKGDEQFFLGEQDNPTAGRIYFDTDPFWLVAGERLALEWDHGKTGNFLEAWITGYWVAQLAGIVT